MFFLWLLDLQQELTLDAGAWSLDIIFLSKETYSGFLVFCCFLFLHGLHSHTRWFNRGWMISLLSRRWWEMLLNIIYSLMLCVFPPWLSCRGIKIMHLRERSWDVRHSLPSTNEADSLISILHNVCSKSYAFAIKLTCRYLNVW